jgi:8-oxo-dGTP diphosphatase
MQGYNVIMVYSQDRKKLLMCKRKKDPYLGLFNLVGGKIEDSEDGPSAAYRELWEETGISRANIELHHLMDFRYYFQECWVEVYVGKLKSEVILQDEVNELFWSDLNHNFFGPEYAGEGNIGHMVEQVKLYEKEIFKITK